jgi:uncharacterized Zn finger protein
MDKEYRLDKTRQEEIIKALQAKNVFQPCPRCRNLEFEVIGESLIPLHEPKGSSWWATAPEIPVVLVSCNNCGYIAQHATGVLGLSRRA